MESSTGEDALNRVKTEFQGSRDSPVRALVAFVEDFGFILSNHMVANKHL